MKTFKSIPAVKKPDTVLKEKKNNVRKYIAEAQKIVDIARTFQFDLIASNPLFDSVGFMTKTSKSDLCIELEKKQRTM